MNGLSDGSKEYYGPLTTNAATTIDNVAREVIVFLNFVATRCMIP